MTLEQEYEEKAYHEAYAAVLRDKKRFEWMLHGIETEKSSEKKIQLAKIAASFAVQNNPGYFTSALLENTFLEYAKQHDINTYDVTYQKNSFLHVMTQAYTTGGHTRVVERWIEQSPNTQKHSIIIINQNGLPLPPRLSEVVAEKNGTLILLKSNTSDLDRALKLREIGLSYQYIILYIYMDDPTSIIAFGTEKFTRPIIFYNHADHLFWIGKCIADQIADLRTITSITTSHRLINDPYMLGVPIENKQIDTITKENARRKLGIPSETKLIVTGGGSHKYHPVMGKSLIPLLIEIVNSSDNRICLVIGPTNTGEWKKANRSTNGKLKAIGPIAYNEGFLDYLVAADVIVDSWPLGGGTFLIDAITLKKPVISLQNPIGQFDYISKSQSYCKNITDFMSKIERILSNEEYAKNLQNEIAINLERDHSIENWTKNLHKMIDGVPTKHHIRDCSTKEITPKIDEWAITANRIHRSIGKYAHICHYILIKWGIPEKILVRICNPCIKIARKTYHIISQ